MADGRDRLLPAVYRDLLSPSVHSVGVTLERAVKLALGPLDGVLWGAEQARDWLVRRVTEKHSSDGVHPDQLRKPDPMVQGWIVLGVQCAGPSEDPLLRNMFAALLAESLLRSHTVHPAFAETLRLLSPLEARIFAMVAAKNAVITSVDMKLFWIVQRGDGVEVKGRKSATAGSTALEHRHWHVLADSLSETAKVEPEVIDVALEGLKRHGLVNVDRAASLPSPRPHRSSRAEAVFSECRAVLDSYQQNAPSDEGSDRLASQRVSSRITVETLFMTKWGGLFANACDAASFFDSSREVWVLPNWAA